ncbi:hypothetical protein [Bacillus velezensis]|uniref:hypothetical protein n=1 Tax=Bacillus velezensis TaxID=492670 RepID=UPI001F4852D1|nr:hypothetical protein [Bacillus velezensis]
MTGFGGTSFVTTVPAAMTEFSPMVTKNDTAASDRNRNAVTAFISSSGCIDPDIRPYHTVIAYSHVSHV